jgi:hypothetical protein
MLMEVGMLGGVAIKSDGVSPSTTGWDPMVTFNHVVEFFQK